MLFAPELAKYEVGNVLLYAKRLNSTQAEIVLSDFYKLPITFVEDSKELAIETYRISAEHKVTYYDASFMALAKLNDATLITDNIKHQGKARSIKTTALKDY